MADTLEIALAGEPWLLHGARAAYWPRRRRLLIADLHLGKGGILRAAGIPVPSGGTAEDLSRLDALLARFEPESLWILGDLVHGSGPPGSWLPQWQAFRQRHAAREVILVPGNHDRALSGLALHVSIAQPSVRDDAFLFEHAPAEDVPAGSIAVGGHLHPVTRVPGLPGRHPCFLLQAQQLLLPAFSRFTGGLPCGPRDTRIACVHGLLLRLPSGT